MKKFTKAIMLLLSVCIGFTFTACGNKVQDTAETLEIYVLDAGYGSDWCSELITLFKQQDWVKEKYPNLNVEFKHNDVKNFAESKLSSGQRVNTYDLIFGISIQSFAGPDGEYLDLTDSVYKSKVPGEDITYEKKTLDSYNQSNKYINVSDIDGDAKYYMTSWVGGMSTIYYNQDILDEFGIKAPNTTDELVSACAVIKANQGVNNGKYDEGYSFIQSKDANYWAALFNIFWAQYEGVDRYLDFWNGIDNNRYSKDIFKQEGREKSLEVFDELLNYDSGYLNPNSSIYEFMQAQTSFLQGNAVFHVNGDWFDNEMESTMAELSAKGQMGNIKMMKMPIVSALGEKLGITDEKLSEIVSYVDGELSATPEITSTTGYSADEVIAAVKEARTVVNSIGPNHNAVIPKYATGKDVAVDFLRFMATDEAIESFIKTTGGASLPFKYSLKEKNYQLYESLSQLQKDRFDYIESGRYETYTLPSERAFPLVQYGGLTAFVKQDYYYTFKSANNTKTPKDYMDETISAWTDSKWSLALSNAGLS